MVEGRAGSGFRAFGGRCFLWKGSRRGSPAVCVAYKEHRHDRIHLLEERKLARSTVRIHLAAFKILYQITLQRRWRTLDLLRIRCAAQKRPTVLSRREVRDLLACVGHPAARMSLTMMYACCREQHVYHSCRNRTCPVCQADANARWLQTHRADLLPVPCFPLVFTVPAELRPVVRCNQRVLYDILMRSAADLPRPRPPPRRHRPARPFPARSGQTRRLGRPLHPRPRRSPTRPGLLRQLPRIIHRRGR